MLNSRRRATRNRWSVCALLWVVFAAGKIAPRAQSELLVLQGGTLIDGTGKAPLPDAVIVVEGDRIRAVGARSEVTIPSGSRIIDARGRYILPGFVDMHLHYYDWLAEVLLAHGITTIMDLGNVTEWILAQKEAVAKGKVKGPRIFCVGASIDGPAGDPERAAGASDPETARRMVRELISKGVDGIKVYQNMIPSIFKVIVEEAHAAGIPVAGHLKRMTAREAADLGIDCLIHPGGLAISMISDPARQERFKKERIPYLPSGEDPHYVWISYPASDPWYLVESDEMDQFIPVLVQKGVYLNPTSSSVWKGVLPRREEFYWDVRRIFTNPDLAYIPPTSHHVPELANVSYLDLWLNTYPPGYDWLTPEELERVRRSYAKFQEFVARFVRAGGKVLPGSDPVGSGVPGIGFHHELQLLVDAGLTPMQALVSATRWSAEFMRKGDLLGTIEPGKLADFVILKKDPLQDISNTKQIDMVIQGGKVLDIGYHRFFRNPLPRPPLFLPNRSQVVNWRLRLQPEVVKAGQGALTLSVKAASPTAVPGGGYFFRVAQVHFDGVPLPTDFVDPTELRVTVPAELVEKVGVHPVTVSLPGPMGGSSKPAYFIVKF